MLIPSRSRACAWLLFRVLFASTCIVLTLLGCTDEKSSSPEAIEAQTELSEDMRPLSAPVQASTQRESASTSRVISGNYMRLMPVNIIDSAGFGQVITATTLLIPAGWQTQGGVVWQINNRSCGRHNPHFAWGASSPDGRMQVQILPEETWGGNNLGNAAQDGCPNIWLTSAQEYLQSYVQYNRPNSQIREYRPRPDIAAEYKHLEQVTPMPMGELKTWVDAGQVVLDYVDQDEQMVELIALLVVFRLNRMQGAVPGEVREFITASTLPGFAMRAPRGELSLKLAETIRTSGKANPQWVQLLTQHNMKMAKINRDGAAARHQIRMDTIREIGEINRRGYESRQRSIDRGNKQFNQYIRDVESFNDPDGSEVELPSTHANAWKLDDGTYILTDDHSFQPFKELGIDGQQLARRP